MSGYSSFYTADAMSMKDPKPYQQPMYCIVCIGYAYNTSDLVKGCFSTYNW